MNNRVANSSQISMALLATVAECRRSLSEHIEFTSHGDRFRRTRWEEVLTVDEFGDTVRLTFGADVQWEAVEGPAATNDVEYRLALEISDSGSRVSSRLTARLQVAIGERTPGIHVVRDEQSEVLPFNEALAQLKEHVDAYSGRGDPLAAEALLPNHRIGPDEQRTTEQS